MTDEEIKNLKRLTTYDPDGFLVWSVPRQRIKVGDRAGTLGSGGYMRMTFRRKTYTVHRAIWAWHHGVWPDSQIDHINRIRHDNRIENLRLASPAENSQNNSARGYYKHRDKWLAKITANGVFYHLGVHKTEEAARKAYLKAKSRLHI